VLDVKTERKDLAKSLYACDLSIFFNQENQQALSTVGQDYHYSKKYRIQWVVVRLFSNRSQMTSKCDKNRKGAHEPLGECITDVLTTF